MLYIPNACTEYRLLAIDPGTTTLGVAILTIDLATGLKRVVSAYTLNAAKSLHRYQNVIETQGERSARLSSHYNALIRIMREYDVHAVVSESPYLGKFPQAYAALTECLQMISDAVATYNSQIILAKIDPATVKNSVGVGGKSGDKGLMLEAVRSIPDLQWDPSIYFESLDEHSIDSVAVGYGHLKQLFAL